MFFSIGESVKNTGHPVISLDTFRLDDLLCSSSVANGTQKSSSQGSESNSSASSLSSGTPVSSLSGLSQVMFPPSLPFGSDMVDVCISTEDQRSGSDVHFSVFSSQIWAIHLEATIRNIRPKQHSSL